MFLGPLALWLCAKAARGDRRFLIASGVVVGLAALTRIDGALLGLPVALVAIRDVSHSRDRQSLIAALACVGAFLLVVAPWAIRQVDTFGTILPSAVSGRALWLTDYQQLFSVAQPPTLDQWLSQGVGWIVSSRLGGLLAALGLFALLPLAAVLAPFAAFGAWHERRNVAFGPFLIYGAALLLVMALLFPILVPHGTFIHASASLIPYTFLLTVVGIGAAVRWIAERRPAWNADVAVRVFSWSAVAVAVIATVVQTSTTTAAWSQARERQTALVASLVTQPPGDRFMAADPGAINYLTGRQGVVTPADSLPVIEQVMRDYDVKWLVLESDQIVPALEPVLTGTDKPDWISGPVAIVNGQISPVATIGPAPSAVPDGALFAVCLTPGDTRCQ
jgi:4-amino-4-deoxy-L-arabinose transferase-like glycosyltransferase